MDIQPGSSALVTVSSRPARVSAQKTLARLFLKDRSHRKADDQNPKPVYSSTRAGRIWKHRPQGSVLRVPEVGESATLHVTVDVMRDLQSVKDFIRIQ